MVTAFEVEKLRKDLENIKNRAMRVNAERSAVVNRAKEICAKYQVEKVEELEAIKKELEDKVSIVWTEANNYLESTSSKLQTAEYNLTN